MSFDIAYQKNIIPNYTNSIFTNITHKYLMQWNKDVHYDSIDYTLLKLDFKCLKNDRKNTINSKKDLDNINNSRFEYENTSINRLVEKSTNSL